MQFAFIMAVFAISIFRSVNKTVPRTRAKMGLEGIVSKRRGSRYVSRSIARLAQVQEPGERGSTAGGRRGLELGAPAITVTRNPMVQATEVFTPTDVPTLTYVERASRNFEADLRNAFKIPKMIVSISGPSNPAKLSLLTKSCPPRTLFTSTARP